MSDSANVYSSQPIEELKTALTRFRGEGHETLSQAGREVQRTLDWLTERAQYWSGMVRRRQQEVERAQSALRACQSDPEANCSAYWQALLDAKERLARAEDNLHTVQRFGELVSTEANDYRRQAQRLDNMLGGELMQAVARLGLHIKNLETYEAEKRPQVANSNFGEAFVNSLAGLAGGNPETAGGIEVERGPEGIEGGI